jgi:hypothetical protein
LPPPLLLLLLLLVLLVLGAAAEAAAAVSVDATRMGVARHCRRVQQRALFTALPPLVLDLMLYVFIANVRVCVIVFVMGVMGLPAGEW